MTLLRSPAPAWYYSAVVHVVIGLSWYCGASPQQLHALYRALYTDAFR